MDNSVAFDVSIPHGCQVESHLLHFQSSSLPKYPGQLALHHMEDLDLPPGPWLQPGPALGAAAIWGVHQQIEDPAGSLCNSFK